MKPAIAESASPAQEHDSRPAWVRWTQYVTGPWTWRNAWAWAKLLLLVLFIKGCLIDQYTIPSGSMEPTLQGHPNLLVGDRVLVNKWIYGPRIPFTTERMWQWEKPERWDIVVFVPPEGTSEHSLLVKRVVGLPGDKIFLWWGMPYVNGKLVQPPPDMREFAYYYNNYDVLWEAERAQSLAGRRQWLSLYENYPLRYGVLPEAENARLYDEYPINGTLYDHEPLPEELPADLGDPELLTVPEGHYFVLGDNSARSVDSRVWGFVPADHILGPVFAVWWPWPHRRDFSGFTQTWWGVLILYGLPVLLVAYEVWRQYQLSRASRREAEQQRQDS